MPNSSPMLTIHDVAAQLNVDERTIRELIHRNDLRAIKIGKEWRITESDLDLYINSHANVDQHRYNGGVKK